MAADPYATLGVARDASIDEIKRAYKAIARANHPDLNPGKPAAEERFKAASAAHALLSDPAKRARFDAGEIDAEGQEAAPAGRYRQHADAAAGARYDFSDVFADIFAAEQRRASAPRRGQDLSYTLSIPLLTAVRGATETLNLPGGRTLSVKIPPGVEDGQVLRLGGQGAPGPNGGPAGDALIALSVMPHPLLRREGADLHMDLPITLAEAVLGGPVVVPTPGGALRVTIPKGSDSGQQMRLRGKGVPEHGGRAAGDLFLTLRIVLGKPDPALEAFLRDHQPATAEDPRAALAGIVP